MWLQRLKAWIRDKRAGSMFTREERARLNALRQRHVAEGETIVPGVESPQLRFARWLVEHGHLSEDDQ